MAADPTWEGLAKGLLVLGVMWWSWVGYAWLTSVVNPEEGGGAARDVRRDGRVPRRRAVRAGARSRTRRCCSPGAYAIVRSAQIGLFLIASRDEPGAAPSVWGLAVSTAVGVRPADRRRVRRRRRCRARCGRVAMRSTWAGRCSSTPRAGGFAPGHFAERHGLIVIIALGESIVAIGVGARSRGRRRRRRRGRARHRGRRGAVVALLRRRRARRRAAARHARRAASGTRSRATPSPTCTSRWSPASCSLALGMKKTLEHVDEPLKTVPAAALLGGRRSTCWRTSPSAGATSTASAGTASGRRWCSSR